MYTIHSLNLLSYILSLVCILLGEEGGDVLTYSHELMEGAAHPCILKGRYSHLETGVGTWKIEMHNDDGQIPQRHTWA